MRCFTRFCGFLQNISLKENQPTLYREVEEYFIAALENPQRYPKVTSFKTTDFGHGRVEQRTYYLSTEVDWYEDKGQWRDLHAIGMVCSKVESNGHISTDTRYFITSLDDIATFSKAVRKHWGIENSLHWCLDMTFHEDYSRIRKDHSAENMAVVRHIAINILKNFYLSGCRVLCRDTTRAAGRIPQSAPCGATMSRLSARSCGKRLPLASTAPL